MTSARDQGRQLEERIGAFFRSHGYVARCNEVLEGRSGGRHEIDVLAEKSDALTTFRVAVECKAWQTPVEKDVVSKLRYVLDDLGLNKGILVSLAGCRTGAQQAAESLGIELWGPDELRRHLGDAAVGELSVPPALANRTVGWGLRPTLPMERAQETLRGSGKGRFGLRTLERLVWVSPVWLPVYWVRLTVAQPETKLLKTRLRSRTVDNVYEGLGGQFLFSAGHIQWEQVETEERATLRPSIRDTKIHAAVRKAVESYLRVTSESAVERHAANLAALGVPTPCRSVSVDETHLLHLPYYAGVLEAGGKERIAAVAGWSGEISEPVSVELTANLAQVRAHFARG